MLRRSFPTLILVSLMLPCAAQTMVFSGGSLNVAAGTTITLEGPLTWQLTGTAVLTNDGTIDLGSEANLEESLGAPITGSGIERALRPEATALNAVEPGGLGVLLTSQYAGGGFELERGHIPSTAANGTESIARWYRVITAQPNPFPMEVVFHYDPTELNGNTPTALALFSAPAYAGPWSDLATTGDVPSNNLMATDQPPTAFLTAFDTDLVLATNTVVRDHMRVWPTLFTEVINVYSTEPVPYVILRDPTGRLVWQESVRDRTGPILSFSVPALPSGSYVLDLGSAGRTKLMRP